MVSLFLKDLMATSTLLWLMYFKLQEHKTNSSEPSYFQNMERYALKTNEYRKNLTDKIEKKKQLVRPYGENGNINIYYIRNAITRYHKEGEKDQEQVER